MKPLLQQLCAEMRARGPVTFAEFMQRALYDPAYGYYAGANAQIGRRGDFFTSVSVGKFFGELLAFQFARWIEAQFTDAAVVQIVEAGAHDGQLARDILESLQQHERKIWERVEYWIVEPSSTRKAAQEQRLREFPNVRWFTSLAELRGQVRGVIFSNELLDAMPVHLLRWNATARNWEELGVTCKGEALRWTSLPLTVQAPALPAALLDVLPNEFVFELSRGAADWWRDAAAALAGGKLLTIDYGGTIEELLLPGRTHGTLRAYSGHRARSDVLANPGGQDITAHVNFTAIQQTGEAAGLRTDTFTTQGRFLTAVAREMWTGRGSWPLDQVRQFQTLTHPEHLGRPFRVLVQGR